MGWGAGEGGGHLGGRQTLGVKKIWTELLSGNEELTATTGAAVLPPPPPPPATALSSIYCRTALCQTSISVGQCSQTSRMMIYFSSHVFFFSF